MQKKTTISAIIFIILAMPLYSDQDKEISTLHDTVNKMDEKIKKMEISLEKINSENNKSKSIYYVDSIQSNITVNSGDYSTGPFTIANNFEVISFLSMTNGFSQRAAFITIKNNGPATRLLKDYFIATFGDNSRVIAMKLSSEEKIKPGAIYKCIAYFGENNFPIINVSTN